MNINEYGLDKYQKNLKELKELICKNRDENISQVDIS